MLVALFCQELHSAVALLQVSARYVQVFDAIGLRDSIVGVMNDMAVYEEVFGFDMDREMEVWKLCHGLTSKSIDSAMRDCAKDVFYQDYGHVGQCCDGRRRRSG